MTATRLNLVFHGRVQGVGFRARAAAVAARRGVTGWVRNESDGTVRCVVEGETGATQEFLNDLLSEMSRYITSHDVSPRTIDKLFTAFTVEYA